MIICKTSTKPYDRDGIWLAVWFYIGFFVSLWNTN